jgi:phosphoglycolate phosphatase
MRPTVLLFDIDGTLITSGGAGRRAIVRAFAQRFGPADAINFSFAGMTDRAIVRAGLNVLGIEDTEREIDAVLDSYLQVLEEEVASASGYRIHPGMSEALAATAGRDRVAVGLGTGNVRRGARIKLERVELADRFSFGGFGCDHEDRPELIRVGATRGADLLGVPLAECRVVIIGDTPKDVAAAQANGAESSAVATGQHKTGELRTTGATFVFPDLSQDGAIEALLGQ